MSRAIYTRKTGEQSLSLLEELTDLYIEARSGEDHNDHPIFHRSQFIERTQSQAHRPGFELVTVRIGESLAGFSFGLPFAEGTWWTACTKPPEHILQAAKFAVIELDVGHAYRGRGYGRALLDALLRGRREPYATLAAIPGSRESAMYKRWGWWKVGVFTDTPIMDALVLDLNPSE